MKMTFNSSMFQKCPLPSLFSPCLLPQPLPLLTTHVIPSVSVQKTTPRSRSGWKGARPLKSRKNKIKGVLTPIGSPIHFSVRTAGQADDTRGGKAGAQGDVVLPELAACNHCSSNCTLWWKPRPRACSWRQLDLPFISGHLFFSYSACWQCK